MSAKAAGPVAFILKGYPRLSETFIAQEILGLERLGLDIRIVSLRRPTDRESHPVHREIAAPVLYLLMHGPLLNREPREYIASELLTVEFALMGGNPWLWGIGLVGLIACVRRGTPATRILILSLIVSLLGQVSGYARLYGWGWPSWLPTLVPHEFQRMFQLAWAVCIGVGIDAAVRWASARRDLLRRALPTALMTLAALALTGAWGLHDADRNLRRFIKARPLADNFLRAIDWIEANTFVDDVFICEPGWAFVWVNAETGRKVWITARGHSNPRVDWMKRLDVLEELMQTTSPKEFRKTARANGIDYVIPSRGWNPRVLTDPELYLQTVPLYVKLLHGGPDEIPIFWINRNTPRGTARAPKRR